MLLHTERVAIEEDSGDALVPKNEYKDFDGMDMGFPTKKSTGHTTIMHKGMIHLILPNKKRLKIKRSTFLDSVLKKGVCDNSLQLSAHEMQQQQLGRI